MQDHNHQSGHFPPEGYQHKLDRKFVIKIDFYGVIRSEACMNNMKVVDPKDLSTAELFPSKERWGWRFRYLSTAAYPPYPEN